MNTESRDRESVTESQGAGWKWIPDEAVYQWWDGERYTSQATWDGAEWKVGPVAKPTPKPKKPLPPERVAIYLWIATISLVLTLSLVASSGEVSVGEARIGGIGFTVFAVFLVLGIRGLRRRTMKARGHHGHREP